MQHLVIIINITGGVVFGNLERNCGKKFADLGRTCLALAASQCHPTCCLPGNSPMQEGGMPGEWLCHHARLSRKDKATAESVLLHHGITAEKMCFVLQVLREDWFLSSAQHLIMLPLELGGPGSHSDKCKWLESHVH